MLQAGVGEQALDGQRLPQEGDRHGEGEEAEADEEPLCGAVPDGSPTLLCTRQPTSMTVGRRALESSALTGAGASLCASGSQWWTGAHPTLAASPPRMRTRATVDDECDRCGAAALSASQSRVASPPPVPRAA